MFVDHTVEDFIQAQDGESHQIQINSYCENARTLLHETEDKSVQGIRPSHFVILKLLGKGATARVFLVRCVINDKVYAMKVGNSKCLET